MKKLAIIFFTSLYLDVAGQGNPTEQAQPIVAEGKRLYKSEITSWYGTDLFLEKYTDKTKIGGYFSYTENEISKCIFFSKADTPIVIGAISFDSTFNTKTAKIDLAERNFTNNENNLYAIRKLALATIRSDTFFKTYKNTNLNLIPIIYNGDKKVYVLTGPEQNGVVIFGNDYLISFDKSNEIISKRQLHRNIIPINYGGKEEEGINVEGTIHSHSTETGDFITATDICTLMLYEKFAKWKQHNVVSEKYLNVWNCSTDQLVVIPMDLIDKIDKVQEKEKKKKNK